MKRYLVCLAAVVVALVALEGSAWLALQWTDGRAAEVSLIDLAEISSLAKPDSEILHPYYGHTPNSHRADLNIMPPPRRQAGTVIIAFLGGSVAHAIAPMLRNAIFRHYLAEGSGTTPIFLDLTNAGYHQPQQALIVANLLVNGGEFDVIVNLDGHEEIIGPLINDSAGVYPFYPRRWSGMVVTSDRQLLLGRRQMLLDERDGVRAGWVESLYGSPTLRLVRHYRLDRINEQIRQNEREWIAGNVGHDLAKHGPRVRYETAELQAASIAVWRRSSWLLSAMAEMGSARYIHFLQPQYTASATPAGDELAAPIGSMELTVETYSESYAMLAEAGQALAAEGVDFVDLSAFAAGGEAPLYENTCCRLTEHGVKSLTQPLLRDVVAAAGGTGANSSTSGGLAPVGRGDFDVYHAGNYVVFAKRPCRPSDTAAPFYLFVEPEPAGLALIEQPDADEWSWSFDEYGTRFADQCVATVPLGDWFKASVRTGQFADDNTPAWEVGFAVSRT